MEHVRGDPKGHRGVGEGRQIGETQRNCVEGGPEFAQNTPRDPCVGSTHWFARVCGGPVGEIGQTRNVVHADPPGAGHPNMLAAALDVCFDQRKFLVAHGHSRKTLQFAERHDATVWECLRAILGAPQAPETAKIMAIFPLSMGGLQR